MQKVKKLVIQFVGKRQRTCPKTGKTKLVPAIAATRRINGNRSLELPSDATQKRGFTHPDAEFLLKAYPKEFKVKTKKGNKI